MAKEWAVSLEKDGYANLYELDVEDLDILNLNDKEYQKVINGNSLVLNSNEEQLLLLYNNEEIAIYNKEDNIYICNVMLKINTQS